MIQTDDKMDEDDFGIELTNQKIFFAKDLYVHYSLHYQFLINFVFVVVPTNLLVVSSNIKR